MLFTLIDAGRFIGTRTMLSQAAAAGARAACVSSTIAAADVTTAVNDAAPALSGMMTVAVTCSGACTYPVATGTSVEVRVSVQLRRCFLQVVPDHDVEQEPGHLLMSGRPGPMPRSNNNVTQLVMK